MERDPHDFWKILIGMWRWKQKLVHLSPRRYPAIGRSSCEIASLKKPICETGNAPSAPRCRRAMCGEDPRCRGIEGKRGLPRHKPPFAAKWAFRRPT